MTFRSHLGANTITGRLVLGFVGILVLLVVAGVVGWMSLTGISTDVGVALRNVQLESRLSSQLSSSLAQVVEAAATYVETRDPVSQEDFRRAGRNAHQAQRDLNALPGQAADEIALLASIDQQLSLMEIRYARAHRLADLNRQGQSRTAAAEARPVASALLADLDRLGRIKAQRVAVTTERLNDEAANRALILAGVILGALVIASIVVAGTVRSISHPLRALVRHAGLLSSGDLTARTTEAMPGEFRILADALNQTSHSLGEIVSVAVRTADEVTSSANDLSSVAEQISSSASHVATAMGDVSEGAESQVQQLREIETALERIREHAGGVRNGASAVTDLAHSIEDTSGAKRVEIERALGILIAVKATVQRASEEVHALDEAAADITRFVTGVSRIAEQTNLLALNAAIEAARAGAAGRGFAVVADEVRKLAEQAEGSAADIIRLTGMITARVARTSEAMEVGVKHVAEIETVSREIDSALTSISASASSVRQAASGVASTAMENAEAVNRAAGSLASIARTAESHAAAAEEISASTQEQSAACEEMTSASVSLLHGSTQLRQLVGGLRT
jgi:methyl-accepting chemotaxis protein